MSGHSKWTQIKHQKAGADAKKSKVFGKLSRLISLAAKKGGDPEMNPVLRDAVAKAKAANMPSDNIQKAVRKGTGEEKGAAAFEEVLFEVFGPGGCAILIEGITDNKNRSLGEIRRILNKHELQLAGAGSCLWAFEKITPDPAKRGANWQPKNIIQISQKQQEALKNLFIEIDEMEDIQDITTNCLLD